MLKAVSSHPDDCLYYYYCCHPYISFTLLCVTPSLPSFVLFCSAVFGCSLISGPHPSALISSSLRAQCREI